MIDFGDAFNEDSMGYHYGTKSPFFVNGAFSNLQHSIGIFYIGSKYDNAFENLVEGIVGISACTDNSEEADWIVYFDTEENMTKAILKI